MLWMLKHVMNVTWNVKTCYLFCLECFFSWSGSCAFCWNLIPGKSDFFSVKTDTSVWFHLIPFDSFDSIDAIDSAWIPLGFHWLGGVRSDRLLLNFREWLESRFDSLEAKWDAKCWLAEEILKCQIISDMSESVNNCHFVKKLFELLKSHEESVERF